jgi:hypothetical protein
MAQILLLTLVSILIAQTSAIPQGSPPPSGGGKSSSGAPANLGKAPVAFGKKPTGCSEYEVLVGKEFKVGNLLSRDNLSFLQLEAQVSQAS